MNYEQPEAMRLASALVRTDVVSDHIRVEAAAELRRLCEENERLKAQQQQEWKLVPVEPTDAMVQAAHHLDLSYMPGQEGADRAAIYRAMLNAAPQPAQQQEPTTAYKVKMCPRQECASAAKCMSAACSSRAYIKPEQPAQQEPVGYLHDLIAYHTQGKKQFVGPVYKSSPTQHQCSRSHPHENMDAMCELRTEIARLTNENARLKARHQDDETNTYRMTLLCIRDGLQQGMSKSIQKLQAREINDVLGLPSFASYRTSPQPSKPWVGLTDEDIRPLCNQAWVFDTIKQWLQIIEAKLKDKNGY